MIKLQTKVELESLGKGIGFKLATDDKVMLLGSCFTDNIGQKLEASGVDVMINPFGTLYNPISLCNSLFFLTSSFNKNGLIKKGFTKDDCIPMGAGANRICSFYHHTSFARETKEEFLENANNKLAKAAKFLDDSNILIITLGTSWVYKREGRVVSNCLKRNPKEFQRERLTLDEAVDALKRIVSFYCEFDEDVSRETNDSFSEGISGKCARRKILWTVSPIRHMKDGAHGNQLSKSILLLAIEEICKLYPEQCFYFPSYEIMLDELRDYRFYADDLTHPSTLAVEYLWEKFCGAYVSNKDMETFRKNIKASKRKTHCPLLK